MTKAIYTLVGMKHRNAEEFVKNLPAGEPLKLVRDPDNKFDPYAVQVWAQDKNDVGSVGHHIGFIKATEVHPLARRMDKSAMKVTDGILITNQGWPQIEVEE